MQLETATQVKRISDIGYGDGINSYKTFLHTKSGPQAEGEIHVGAAVNVKPFVVRISDLNIWDRMLSDDEIAKMAQSCGSNQGNMKNWYDIKNELNLDLYNVKEPSTCDD